MENQNQVIISNTDKALFEATPQTFFSSIVGEDRATKSKVYNSMDTNESLSDRLGEILYITDVIAHPVTLEDENTGAEVNQIRVVLIDKDGEAYYAISEGVMGSLENIMAIVGRPTWTPPLPLTPYETKSRKGFRVLKLRIAEVGETPVGEETDVPTPDKNKA